MTKLTWHGILEAQQKDFIQRLKSYLSGYEPESPGSPVTLSCLEHDFYEQCECHYSEIIEIHYPFPQFEEDIDNHSYQMINKFPRQSNYYSYEDCYANYKIGKLGEEAVKICLDKLVSKVDYKIDELGDGGSDFYLASNKSIKLQVKTKVRSRIYQREKDEINERVVCYYDRRLNSRDNIDELDNIKWSINSKEVKNNSLIICVLMLNPVAGDEIIGQGYSLAIAGFKPTDMINNRESIKIKDLFYGGGIRAYLESIS
jgi:hypothetical protein